MKTLNFFIKKYAYLLHDVFNWVTPVAFLEWKNWEGTAGPRKKVGANINVSPAWWFSVVMKIDLLWLTLSNQHRLVNSVRTVAKKSSHRLKFCWLKVVCYICQSNELEREIQYKTGGPSMGEPKIWWRHGPPRNRHWVTPGQSTTSCLQLFGIFITMQRSCFKQMIASW